MNILKVSFRAIAQATEDEGRVREAMNFASGLDEIDDNIIDGHFGNKLMIMTAGLGKKRQIRDFLARLNDAGLVQRFVEEVEDRIDGCPVRFLPARRGQRRRWHRLEVALATVALQNLGTIEQGLATVSLTNRPLCRRLAGVVDEVEPISGRRPALIEKGKTLLMDGPPQFDADRRTPGNELYACLDRPDRLLGSRKPRDLVFVMTVKRLAESDGHQQANNGEQ